MECRLIVVLRATLLVVAVASSGFCFSYHAFDRVLLSEAFVSEGACFADINGDGHNDIVSGPYWYAGPQFRKRQAYASAASSNIQGYSEYFFSFADDFNGDGRPDILTIGMPGQPAYWHENPGATDNVWPRHLALQSVGNESPTYVDLTGDGIKELVCIVDGAIGYAVRESKRPTEAWRFVAATDSLGYGEFTHGLGVGDVDGDGRMDLLESNGWWRQGKPGEPFRLNRYPFAQAAAQIFAYDFDGDGDKDIVATQNAHGYGLSWFEQRSNGSEIGFVPHVIMTASPVDNPWGLAVSQMHAVALADIDGDGVKDIVTGKRYWAHGGNDPGSKESPVLYWLRTKRGANGVEFEPHLISDRVGVGTQLVVGDVNGDRLDDIVVGNKLGTFLLLHQKVDASPKRYPGSQPRRQATARHVIGTPLFGENIRTTEPLTALEQRNTFSLPPGFEIELVACEPQIAKPMNMAFDADGRLWVTSSEEYPFAVPEGRAGRDKIVVFEDADNNGSLETATTFASGLNIPLGLYPYKNGVICFSVPNILFLEDVDGDGQADRQRVLYGPFDTTRDTHGMCNSFLRGLDGWLYACHGFNNQSTVAGTDGEQVAFHSGNTFRMRLDGRHIELFTAGQVNPFGMTSDASNDLLTADCHTRPINLLIRGGAHESFAKSHNGLGFIPNVMEHLHHSTGIGGVALGADTDFPAIYQSSAFGGNVVTSRINRNTLQRAGSSLVAVEEPDFCVSSDPWFRPVDLKVGPDGSLYVADFYNRIIGHYEVDLNHPGRDRRRGRIWRISFRDNGERRDELVDGTRESGLKLKADSMVAELNAINESRARIAMDAICDSVSGGIEGELVAAMADAAPRLYARIVWILHRRDQLTTSQLNASLSHASDWVRLHAFQVAADSRLPFDGSLVVRALLDANRPRVARAAVSCAYAHPEFRYILPLLQTYDRSLPADVHLRYAVKLALASHLQDDSWFREVASKQDLSRDQKALLADICVHLGNRPAAIYLAGYLASETSISPEKRKTYFRIAAKGVEPSSADELILLIRSQLAEKPDEQLELLNVMRDSSNPVESPEELKLWASYLADVYLLPRPGESPASRPWTFMPHPDTQSRQNAFAISTQRRSADGMQATEMWSSFPNGENGTGVYRSPEFRLGDSLSFYMCGHDGSPQNVAQGKNFIVMRDMETQQVLKRAAPPRSDTASRVRWDTSKHQGRVVCVELVDGDTGGAFAWLAAGRFSEPQLNPGAMSKRIGIGAKLVADYGLKRFRGRLAKLLQISHSAEVGMALARLDGAVVNESLARALSFSEAPPTIRDEIVSAVADATDDASEILVKLFSTLDVKQQLELAKGVLGDADSVALLMDLLDEGIASTRLLGDPKFVEELKLVLDGDGDRRLDGLIQEIPDESEATDDLINSRVASYRQNSGSDESGMAVFAKNCANCHQIDGQGKRFGPNLDGIGNRGVQRIVEDIVAPNRNVDVAFRSTNLSLKDGTVLSGLLRDSVVPHQFLMIDEQGKERLIPRSDIEEQSDSRLSPMPGNFGSILSEQQFRDLLAYLLKQK